LSSNISLVCHLFGILPARAPSQLNLSGRVSKTRSHTQSRHVRTDAIENLYSSAVEYLPSILLVL